ncbi:hypothetical protein BGW41_004338 [Actinomortierella wolfii]|nr:hypothetical protein BGW41_004338 [Actinomortierella wolfii]
MGQIDPYSRARTGSSASLFATEAYFGNTTMSGRGQYGVTDDHDDPFFAGDTLAFTPSSTSDPYTQQIRWNAVLQTREMPKCPMCRTALYVQGWDRIEKKILIPTSASGRRHPSPILSSTHSSSSPSGPPSHTPELYSGSTPADHERGRTNQRIHGQRSSARGGAPTRSRLGPTPHLRQRATDHDGEEDDGVELEQVTRFHGRDPLSYQPLTERMDTTDEGERSPPVASIIGRRPSEWMRYQQQQIQAQQEQNRRGQDPTENNNPVHPIRSDSFRTQADTMAILDRHQQQIQRLYREQQEQEELLRMLAARALSLVGGNGGETDSTSEDQSTDPEIREGQRHRLSMAQPRLQVDTLGSRSDGRQTRDSIRAQGEISTRQREVASGHDDTQSGHQSPPNDANDDADNTHSYLANSLNNNGILDELQQGTRAWAEEDSSNIGPTASLNTADNRLSNVTALSTSTLRASDSVEQEQEQEQEPAQNDLYRLRSPDTSQLSPVDSLSSESNLSLHTESSLALESSQASAAPDSSTRPPSIGSRFSFTSSRSEYRRDRESQSTIQSHGLQMPRLELPLNFGVNDGAESQELDQMDHDRETMCNVDNSSTADEMNRHDFEPEATLASISQSDDGIASCGSSGTRAPLTSDESCMATEPQDSGHMPALNDSLSATAEVTGPVLVIDTATVCTASSASDAVPTPLTSTVQGLQVMDTAPNSLSSESSVRLDARAVPQCSRSPTASPLPTPLSTTPARARFPRGVLLDGEDGSDSEVEADSGNVLGQRTLRSELELRGFSLSDVYSANEGSSSSSLELPPPRIESVASVRTWMEEEQRELRECIPALSLPSPLSRNVPITIPTSTAVGTEPVTLSEPDIPEPCFFSPSSATTSTVVTTQTEEQAVEDTPTSVEVAEDTDIPSNTPTDLVSTTINESTNNVDHEASLNDSISTSRDIAETADVSSANITIDQSIAESHRSSSRRNSTHEDQEPAITSDPLDVIQSTTAHHSLEPATTSTAENEFLPSTSDSSIDISTTATTTADQPNIRPQPSVQEVMPTISSPQLTTRPYIGVSRAARSSQHDLPQVPRTVRATPTATRTRDGRRQPHLRSSPSPPSSTQSSTPTVTAASQLQPLPPPQQFRIHVRFQPKLPKAHVMSDLISQIVVECPHRVHGCTETMPYQAAPTHVRDQCRFRIVTCPRPRCGLQMRADLILEHVLKSEAASVVGSPVLSSSTGSLGLGSTGNLGGGGNSPPSSSTGSWHSGAHSTDQCSVNTRQGLTGQPIVSTSTSTNADTSNDAVIPSCPGLTWEREQLARATAIIAQLTEENSGLRNSMRQLSQQNANLLKEKERWKRYENLRFK